MAYEDFLQIREDGKPILTKPYTQLSTQQINEYKKHHKLWRKAYRHHKDERKEHISYKTFDYKLIEQDPAILRYFTVVRNRPRNEGFLSDDTRRQVLYAARCWLLFLGKEITNHSITDLINFKKENRNDYSIEDELEQFAITGKISVNKVYASFILGIFKHNRAKLDSHIDNHHRTTTKPLSDGILMKILSELPEREQQLLKYQAYAGQRIKALCAVPLEQIDMTHPKYAIIHIMPHQNKTRQDHNCLVPKELMETILHRCKQLYLPTPFPNYEELWKQITKYVRINYNIRLTSHYLRKRFATIASKTSMDVNQWDYLMGTKKSKGHDASIYNLTILDDLIKDYDTYLVHELSLDKSLQTANSPSTDSSKTTVDLLQEIITQQARQIELLTRMLSK